LKTAVICSELVRRFPHQTILSVSGIRREESASRAGAPIARPQPKLTNVTRGTSGLDWHPIIEWRLRDVLGYLERNRFPLHEAYTVYGSSRVSCAFCVLGAARDLAAAARCAEKHDVDRDLVHLEIESTFPFQEGHWLGDIAPTLLSDQIRDEFAGAQRRAQARERAESRIPEHLLYECGWPQRVPSWAEARLLAEVRTDVATAVGIVVGFTEPAAIVARYEELYRSRRQMAGRGSAATP
jgi:hypothetical protein